MIGLSLIFVEVINHFETNKLFKHKLIKGGVYMKKTYWISYLLYTLWVIGLIILAIISVNYENQIQQTSRETFNLIPVIWSKLFISIIFGLYISLVFVKKWSFSINPPMLWCVAIPCIIISFAFPIVATFSSVNYLPEILASSPISFGLQKIFSTNVFGIIAGLTIILSLFNAQPNNKNHH